MPLMEDGLQIFQVQTLTSWKAPLWIIYRLVLQDQSASFGGERGRSYSEGVVVTWNEIKLSGFDKKKEPDHTAASATVDKLAEAFCLRWGLNTTCSQLPILLKPHWLVQSYPDLLEMIQAEAFQNRPARIQDWNLCDPAVSILNS